MNSASFFVKRFFENAFFDTQYDSGLCKNYIKIVKSYIFYYKNYKSCVIFILIEERRKVFE